MNAGDFKRFVAEVRGLSMRQQAKLFELHKANHIQGQMARLMPVIGKEGFLVSDANPSYRYFARDNGISHRAINLRAGVRVMSAIHIQNVNAYHSRFRG